jgi:hypothetical protein
MMDNRQIQAMLMTSKGRLSSLSVYFERARRQAGFSSPRVIWQAEVRKHRHRKKPIIDRGILAIY